ncbi:hypothetical protein RJ639_032440 [Escallonia herrerae]|uniref:Uncharacterized protein n=1 Tax=Escallonia herrerae TaxID=1293975 RepID=A0AA88WU66_9ASTE|nr:hypothetical protein RJ639_032440 [Escallonia herrerae]
MEMCYQTQLNNDHIAGLMVQTHRVKTISQVSRTSQILYTRLASDRMIFTMVFNIQMKLKSDYPFLQSWRSFPKR